tara:strand:+ start:655 stop:1662 length:1008 start_codon:yes stop_codon:yes gene_type:complete
MKKILIIAEAGINHNSKVDIAKKMILVAKKSGADIVKFQTAIPEDIVTKHAKKTEYQIKNTKLKNETQFEMQKKLHFPLKIYKILFAYCKKLKIEFLSTAFDLKSLEFLISLGMKKIKIPSGEITNVPLLIKVGKLNRTTFLSTGMSNLKEIKKAIEILLYNGLKKKNLFILHCTSDYPLELNNVNLNILDLYKKEFGKNVGYSDHTLGNEAAMVAVGKSVKILEKHFTLNKKMKGPDHIASLDPSQLKSYVNSIRKAEIVLGKNKKILLNCEKNNIKESRKSIVAKSFIKKNEKFTFNNITTKRPNRGICASMWNKVVGKKAKRNFKIDEFIEI